MRDESKVALAGALVGGVLGGAADGACGLVEGAISGATLALLAQDKRVIDVEGEVR